MIIVFKGRGWLVPVSALAAVVLCGITGLRSPYVVWPMFAASGLLDHWLGRKWNSADGRLFKDLQTGQIVEQKPDNSFFWIPMQHWLWIKLVLAALALTMVAQMHKA